MPVTMCVAQTFLCVQRRSVKVIATPIAYDYNEAFPGWATEVDLASSVSFIHAHVLIDHIMEKGAFWRPEGSVWTAQAPGLLGDVRTLGTMPQRLATRFIETVAAPFFSAHRHQLTRTQEIAFSENVEAAKQEFVQVLRENSRATPGYLATMTDETVLSVLHQVGTNLADR